MVRHSTRDFATLRNDSSYRHWAPDSELYAPATVLEQHLSAGWEPDEVVAVESFYHAGYRRSEIYYFTLHNGGEVIEIPVLGNPAVFKIVEIYQLTTLRINIDKPELAIVNKF